MAIGVELGVREACGEDEADMWVSWWSKPTRADVSVKVVTTVEEVQVSGTHVEQETLLVTVDAQP